MWMFVLGICLALTNIAGDNVGVVPDISSQIGSSVYITTLLAYFIFGALLAALSAWIGIKSGQELTVFTKRTFGEFGNKVLAAVMLAVCIPASALTGGYFSSNVLYLTLGVPHIIGVPLSLALFAILGAGYCKWLIKWSNYISLALVPAILLVTVLLVNNPHYNSSIVVGKQIDWILVAALLGYNAGGMRPALLAETAACLKAKGNKVVFVVVMAKILEGVLTLLIAHLVLCTNSEGPLALSKVIQKVLGDKSWMVFNFILFCLFMSTMVPAMVVNAKQMSTLTGSNFKQSLVLSTIIICIISMVNFSILLNILSLAGIVMTVLIIYMACFLHKYGLNQ